MCCESLGTNRQRLDSQISMLLDSQMIRLLWCRILCKNRRDAQTDLGDVSATLAIVLFLASSLHRLQFPELSSA